MTDQPTIEIVSIDRSKTLDEIYAVSEDGSNPDAVAILGAILRDVDGNLVKDAVMTATTPDEEQDKNMNGTGNFWGPPQNVNYYPLNYVCKKKGDHMITFEALDVKASVTLTAK